MPCFLTVLFVSRILFHTHIQYLQEMSLYGLIESELVDQPASCVSVSYRLQYDI